MRAQGGTDNLGPCRRIHVAVFIKDCAVRMDAAQGVWIVGPEQPHGRAADERDREFGDVRVAAPERFCVILKGSPCYGFGLRPEWGYVDEISVTHFAAQG